MFSHSFVGAEPDQARTAVALLGAHHATYLALAQRCIWGITQSDLVRVDVGAALAALRRNAHHHPLTPLFTAFVLHRTEPERAADALEEARARLGRGHALDFLLPEADDWEGRRRAAPLKEVIPGRVWRVEALLCMRGTRFQIGSIGTLVRTERGELVFINPVSLSEVDLTFVKNLGRMSTLVVQGRAHSQFVESVRAQFPEARVVLSHGHRQHPVSSHLVCNGILGTDSAQLPDEFLELPVHGTDADEVLIYHRPTRLLVLQDLVSNNLASHHGRSFAGRLEYLAFGLIDRIGLLSYHPILWRDLRRLQRSLAALLALDCAYVTGAHWPLAFADESALLAFQNTLRFVLRLSRVQHMRLMASFFARQPGFLRDLALYRRDTAH